jgi:hypothetical protein
MKKAPAKENINKRKAWQSQRQRKAAWRKLGHLKIMKAWRAK